MPIQTQPYKNPYLYNPKFLIIFLIKINFMGVKILIPMVKTIIILFFLSLIHCRRFQTSMKFSYIGKNGGWIYLDKMTFAPGQVEFKVKTSPNGIPYGKGGYVTIEAIPEYRWEEEKQRKCLDVPKQPFAKHKISVTNSAIDFTRQSFNIQQTTLYYFVLKDCQKSLRAQYDNNNLQLKIDLHLLNNNRQIGQEQDHWYILPIILVAGIWLVTFYNNKLKGEHLKTQYHKLLMFGGIATQISSLVWKTFGYLIYVYTGADYTFFHIIYLLMHSISESLVIGLVILIGFGWTINYVKLNNEDLYYPILGGMSFLNAIFTLFTKVRTTEHDKHHIFDNISGNILVGYRIILAVVFFVAITNTYQKSRTKVKNFVSIFGLVGGLYILALPLIIWIGNNFVQAKDRHQFVFVAMEGLKCLTNIWMSLMLNHQKSYYNEISYDKRSFLPQESKYF